MKSVMTHQFSKAPTAQIQRSKFDRSHGLKTTFDADKLVPIIVDDIVPGDTFNLKANFFIRLATPIHPIMDNIYIDTFFFFVPYRLVWDNWERFCGAQDDPSSSIDFTIPKFATAGEFAVGTLGHYFGLPETTNLTTQNNISVLPFRAYRLIFNDWFRDQNLTDTQDNITDDGPDAIASHNIFTRAKRHDYFTSCLPAPQKGSTAVAIPLGGTADVFTASLENSSLGVWSTVQADHVAMDTDGTAGGFVVLTSQAGSTPETGKLYADLSGATNVTINELRLAFQTQKLLERDARSGTRYNETILAHFGVTVPDFRVQRPEYLGGGSSRMNITPVPQTTYQGTPTVEDAKGNLAGYGTASGQHGFTKSFTEHGVLIGIVNARADITYSQGVERYWTKSTRYDFYYPILAQIGEQAVLNKEIFAQADSNDELVFGYQERYAEMRYKPSRLTGLFAVDATGSLSTWHLSEDFASLPTLGNTFIAANTGVPLDRAIAVSTEPQFIADFYFDLKCARPMPLFGIPGNMDRF